MKAREFLWYIGLVKNCPWCGSRLEKTGHVREFWQDYICVNPKCRFGKTDQFNRL